MRNGQLDKEAGELRDENAQLATECEKLRSNAAHGARVCPKPSLVGVPAHGASQSTGEFARCSMGSGCIWYTPRRILFRTCQGEMLLPRNGQHLLKWHTLLDLCELVLMGCLNSGSSLTPRLCSQAAEASGKVQELQAELADAYKRLSKASEELLQVNCTGPWPSAWTRGPDRHQRLLPRLHYVSVTQRLEHRLARPIHSALMYQQNVLQSHQHRS